MPANPASLRLEDVYRAQLKRLWRQVTGLIVARYAIDSSDIAASYDDFATFAASQIAVGQEAGITLAHAYLTTFAEMEGKSLELAPARAVGETIDGRPLVEALGATRAKMLLQIKEGRTPAEAISFGRFSTERFAHTEVVDASRHELSRQMEISEEVSGWRRVASGNSCGACLAAANGEVHTNSYRFFRHAGCDCFQEPVLRGVKERVHSPTGKQRFNALSPEEQNALLGEEKAKLIRSGEADFQDLIKIERPEEWENVITEAPLEALTN